MNEPADGATTMKKKAAEKLAAKANPVVETPVVAEVQEVEAVVETPAEVEAVVETPEAPAAEAEATPEAAAE
jgi:small subunit ribosomal protein S16